MTLNSPVNATIATGTGTGTIDDIPPTLSINNSTVTAPLPARPPLTSPSPLSAPSNQTVTVNYATSDGTATNPTDYLATSGELIFSSGQTSKTIAITIEGDSANNPPETYSVVLSSPSNATIATGTGTGTIDDMSPTWASVA